MQPHALSFQLRLQSSNIEFIEFTALLHRNRRCHTSTLPCHSAAHHVACRGMTHPVTPGNATRTNQVFDALGYQCAIGYLKLTTGRRQDENTVAVNEFLEKPNAVLEATLLSDIRLSHVVGRINFSRITNPKGHPKIA